ncbi:type I polyketide synthase [Streptomyces chumphonensis]|uniref:type I polyketide synthase n=1 Tax=Streptomyces chumphonensis TaxID=1214925 RepID=UPI003D7653AB
MAVIGLSGRFPGAGSAAELWENIASGRESLTRFTREELAAAGVPPQEYEDPAYVPVRGLLDGVEEFDAGLYGYAPREAELIDPQQRLLLSCAWEALEDGGHGGREGRTGVFVGTSASTYLMRHLLPRPELVGPDGLMAVMLGNDKDHAATRIAYKLGLTGPATVVQTACSTSLVAVHHAARSLLRGECDTALAGGASITVPQRSGYLYRPHGILSPDGRCRAFDRRAAGTVAGSGVGLVLLKRAEDAIRDGDPIRALLRGSAINNDGGDKAGYTAPSISGQTAVIRAAHAAADVRPDDIDYVETHGTGTELGDGVEVAALSAAFRAGTDRRGYCAIGSLKPNIGHLDAAAGVASLIKVVLALQHRVLPPSIHCEEVNPALRLAESPFHVNRTARPWERGTTPRRCGVSSFGVGGTNAHVVLEEAPARSPRRRRPDDRPQLVVLSAAAPESLTAMTDTLVKDVADRRPALDDVAHTLRTGRSHLGVRRAAVARTADELHRALGTAPVRTVPRVSSLVFQFPGQGSQYPGMAAALRRAVPAFREHLDACLDLVDPGVRRELVPLLTDDGASPPGAEDGTGTRLAQPALFITQYALARVLTGWGLRPKALIGHSIGEYTAACLGGALELDAALRLVTARGEIMAGAPRGAMLALAADEDTARGHLFGSLSVAAVNAPAETVVGGTEQDVAELAARLAAHGVRTKRLRVSHAFHTALMDPAVDAFRAVAASVDHARLRTTVVSNVTGGVMHRRRGYSADYWARHLREPVRYADGLGHVLALPRPILVEVGPGRSLTGLALRTPGSQGAVLTATMPEPPTEEGAASRHLLEALGTAWSAGAGVDWDAFGAGTTARRVSLPTYVFRAERHWIDAPRTGTAAGTEDPPPPERTPQGTAASPAPAAPSDVDGDGGDGDDGAAASGTQQRLAGIWTRLLGIPDPGPESDFYALGGHSLLAVSLLAGIRKDFGVELSLNETHHARTLRAQAELVTARMTSGPPATTRDADGSSDSE